MMKTICITGLDGSGKSTQAKLLQKHLENALIVSVWDIIKRQEFKDWTIYLNPPPVEQYVMNLSPLSRTLFIFHAFNEAYQRALQSEADWLIFDGYWYKYWAVEQAMGSPAELSAFFSKQYLVPDYTFYMDIPVDDILSRKKQLSVYESANDKNAFQILKKIQNTAQDILKSLLPSKTFYIDAKQTKNQINENILKLLNPGF